MTSTLALASTTTPIPSFADLGLPTSLVRALSQRGITQPLPIQAATIADALAGRDVAGKAPTGSGKTLAFALPIAANVRRSSPRRPRALVLAPTRELAGQISDVMSSLLAPRQLRSYPFYGGVGFGGQRKALHQGVEVAVACPGRLEDLMSTGDIKLSEVEVVVIDEADRMADMGFIKAVCRILDATPAGRQTLLFSATLDGDVDVLVRRYQTSPALHDVVSEEEPSRALHLFRDVAREDRAALCVELVNDPGTSVVFVRTKHGADRVARHLKSAGAPAAAIHGDRSQAQREQALAAFRSGKVRALVATDVAARGIHVDDVARVIHYDLPADVKDYVHRSGRTARAGAEGTVIAFVTPEQQALATTLKRHLGLATAGAPAGGTAPRSSSQGRRPSPGRRGGAMAKPSARQGGSARKFGRAGSGPAQRGGSR